ncbi:MAG TPA: DUF4286 family protein, partial [Acetobacteraceae bacterium]|nr:DUF4286 family protein [Acetobacteraceae bacterium]
RLLRFEGDQVVPGDLAAPEGAEGLLAVSMNVAPEAEAEFNEWYNTEHIPLLGAVPGILSARRFRAAGSGVERKYLALYNAKSVDAIRSDAWNKAANTPWTERMRPHFRDLLSIRCTRYRRRS